MKCAIVLTDGIKQIMLTPENDSEKQALRMITRDDDITIETAWGTFYDSRPLGYDVSECGGGYLRGFRSDESLMLVLRRKAAKQTEAVLAALPDELIREDTYRRAGIAPIGDPPCPPAPPELDSIVANAGSQRRVATDEP